MFKELASTVKSTGLTISVTAAGENEMTLVILPQIKAGAHEALSTPLILTGTPEELDEKLPAILTQYGQSRKSLEETLAETTAFMVAAGKDAEQSAVKAATAKPAPARAQVDEEEDGIEEVSAGVLTGNNASAPIEINLFG